MKLFRRIGDLVSANLNDLLERLESPEALLRQAVREMEAAAARARGEAAQALAAARLAGGRLAEQERLLADWEARAEEAVADGDDALARRALARRHACLVA